MEVSFLSGLLNPTFVRGGVSRPALLTQRTRSGRYNGKRAAANDWFARGEGDKPCIRQGRIPLKLLSLTILNSFFAMELITGKKSDKRD